MRRLGLVSTVVAAALAIVASARAGTLGDPQIGFSADRVLIFDRQTYVGRMWSMPGEQRHEQVLPAIEAVFVLRADSAIADILLPSLHTAVELPLPRALAALQRPSLLGTPLGREVVNGIATIKYAVDETIPDGHLGGTIWLSREGIPMRCDGSFISTNGKVSAVHWELRHVRIGRQDRALFEVPPGYATISPQAASTLLGLRLAPRSEH
jgi:hypothetical protein